MSPRPVPVRRHLATSPFKPAVVEHVDYAIGDWVDSDRHGLGRVIGFEGEDPARPTAVVVNHRGGDVRRFTLPSTTLTKLGTDADAESDAEPGSPSSSGSAPV